MRLKNEKTVEIVDTETGEIQTLVTSKEYSTRVKTDNFYMTFIDYISPFYKLKSDNAKNLLVWLCEHAEWNTGEVNLTTADRERIALEFGICNNTITNNLQSLKKLNLISGEKGKFMINPQIFWKGDTKTRGQLLKDGEIKIKFSIDWYVEQVILENDIEDRLNNHEDRLAQLEEENKKQRELIKKLLKD